VEESPALEFFLAPRYSRFLPLVLAVLQNFTELEGFAASRVPEKPYPFYFEFITGVAQGEMSASH
jgi:hypothetical protein